MVRQSVGGVTGVGGVRRHSVDMVDCLVDLAHSGPRAAEAVLAREPGLAGRRSSWGETRLEAASHLGHRRLALHLLELGVRPDLFAECSLGDTRRAATALRAGDHELLGVHGLPVLHFAIVSRDPLAIEALLEAGALVNSPAAALPPLHSAVAWNQVSTVRRLLDAGADPMAVDAFGCTAADWADQLGSPWLRDILALAGGVAT